MGWISYEGIGEVAVTLGMLDSVEAGMPLTFLENDWVRPARDGEKFCGVAMKRGGIVNAAQVKGFVRVSYSGELSLGWNTLVANGQGGVRQSNDGLMILVAEVDDEDYTAVICL